MPQTDSASRETALRIRGRSIASAWADIPRSMPGSIEKTEEWLSIPEATAILGTTRFVASFKRTWDALVAAAAGGQVPELNGAPVRMAACTIKGVDRWCIHRRSVMLIAEHTQKRERRWPTRPKGWLTLEEAAALVEDTVDPDVMADAWRALTKGTTYEGFTRIAGLEIRMRRGHVHANERWFIHPEDAAHLAENLRGRLPHLRKGFICPARLVCHLQHDSHDLARQLLASLGDMRITTGQALLDGKPVEVRRFLVEGVATACLAEADYPLFVEKLTEMHDANLAAEISGFEI